VRRIGKRLLIVTTIAAFAQAAPVSAQNWSFDAREIALGGAGNGGDIAAAMIDEERAYRAIVLPFGLLQVVPNWHVFNPSDVVSIRSARLSTPPARSTTSSAATGRTPVNCSRPTFAMPA
jgi:hypothetical protein